MEISFSAGDQEEKICFLGHLFGFLSGFIVGFIVLDNRKEEPWETITGRVLFSAYIMVFLCMIVLHMGEFSIVKDVDSGKFSIHNSIDYVHAFDQLLPSAIDFGSKWKQIVPLSKKERKFFYCQSLRVIKIAHHRTLLERLCLLCV